MANAENLQVQTDLADRADFSKIKGDGGSWYSAPSRTEMLKQALDIDTIHCTAHGSWQGSYGFVFVYDGYVWLIKEYYGSCALCDGVLACDNTEQARQYAKSMMQNAYAFESKNDAVRFLHLREEDDSWGWGRLVDGMIEDLNSIRNP